MKFITTYKTELAAVAITAILCVAAFAAWNAWFKEPLDYTKHAAEIEQLREELKLSAAEKEAGFAAYQDSMAMHDAQLKELLADTLTTNEITHRHETIRQNNNALDADSAAALGQYRMRIEHEYRQRFDYTY